MSISREAEDLIRLLEAGSFIAECPCCQSPISLKKAGLFYLDNFTPGAEALYKQRKADLKDREAELKENIRAISKTSKVGAKAVNIGLILERLAPSMKGFRFDRNDCRSLFDPIDYVIFEGLNSKGIVSKIFFIDIKTGQARLKSKQREIKSVISQKQVEWDTY